MTLPCQSSALTAPTYTPPSSPAREIEVPHTAERQPSPVLAYPLSDASASHWAAPHQSAEASCNPETIADAVPQSTMWTDQTPEPVSPPQVPLESPATPQASRMLRSAPSTEPMFLTPQGSPGSDVTSVVLHLQRQTEESSPEYRLQPRRLAFSDADMDSSADVTPPVAQDLRPRRLSFSDAEMPLAAFPWQDHGFHVMHSDDAHVVMEDIVHISGPDNNFGAEPDALLAPVMNFDPEAVVTANEREQAERQQTEIQTLNDSVNPATRILHQYFNALHRSLDHQHTAGGVQKENASQKFYELSQLIEALGNPDHESNPVRLVDLTRIDLIVGDDAAREQLEADPLTNSISRLCYLEASQRNINNRDFHPLLNELMRLRSYYLG
jgi:hypothetical protein